MRRRTFIATLGGAIAWPVVARSEQPVKIVGFLGLGPAPTSASRVDALRAGLRDLGYVEGKNVVIEFRC
jgi:putative ABC transport system substrate-binding protein